MIWLLLLSVPVIVGSLFVLRYYNKKKRSTEVTLPEVRSEPQPIPFTPIRKQQIPWWEVKSKKPSFPLRQKLKRTGAI